MSKLESFTAMAGASLKAGLPDWLNRLLAALQQGHACVLVTVVEVKGSAPREAGARMLVLVDRQEGTIGGGNLEFQAIRAAQDLLADAAAPTVQWRRYTLGPALGQCCGGVVALHFERLVGGCRWPEQAAGCLRSGQVCYLSSLAVSPLGSQPVSGRQWATGGDFPPGEGDVHWVPATGDGAACLVERIRPNGFNLVVYGAGHVGQAVVRILAGLPCQVYWVDPRPDQFPATIPANVGAMAAEVPTASVALMPADSYYLVLTHDHALDFDLCDHILARQDVRFLGLIGSETKAARFRKRLRERGVPDGQLGRLVCPVGLEGIGDKHPSAIAVSIVAQILLERSR